MIGTREKSHISLYNVFIRDVDCVKNREEIDKCLCLWLYWCTRVLFVYENKDMLCWSWDDFMILYMDSKMGNFEMASVYYYDNNLAQWVVFVWFWQ